MSMMWMMMRTINTNNDGFEEENQEADERDRYRYDESHENE